MANTDFNYFREKKKRFAKVLKTSELFSGKSMASERGLIVLKIVTFVCLKQSKKYSKIFFPEIEALFDPKNRLFFKSTRFPKIQKKFYCFIKENSSNATRFGGLEKKQFLGTMFFRGKQFFQTQKNP